MKKFLVGMFISSVVFLSSQSALAHHEPEGALTHHEPEGVLTKQDVEVIKKTKVKKPKPKTKTCGSDMINCF